MHREVRADARDKGRLLLKRAILLVDHGSRRAAANAVIEAVAREVAQRRPDCSVHFAHMELAPPSIVDAVRACAEAGAEELIIHPYFLSVGNHSEADIPRLVREACAAFPQLRARVSAPLGPHSKLVEIVLERIAESETSLANGEDDA